MNAPSTNAPNSAWIPLASVATAESSIMPRTPPPEPTATAARSASSRAAKRTSSGRTTTNITSEVGGDVRRRSTPRAHLRARDADTNASSVHALASSTAAQVSAVTPSGVL
jgi:hypothetical protein